MAKEKEEKGVKHTPGTRINIHTCTTDMLTVGVDVQYEHTHTNLCAICSFLRCSRQISAIVETVREQQCSGSAQFYSSTAAPPRPAALAEGRIRNAPQKMWNVKLEVKRGMNENLEVKPEF